MAHGLQNPASYIRGQLYARDMYDNTPSTGYSDHARRALHARDAYPPTLMEQHEYHAGASPFHERFHTESVEGYHHHHHKIDPLRKGQGEERKHWVVLNCPKCGASCGSSGKCPTHGPC